MKVHVTPKDLSVTLTPGGWSDETILRAILETFRDGGAVQVYPAEGQPVRYSVGDDVVSINHTTLDRFIEKMGTNR